MRTSGVRKMAYHRRLVVVVSVLVIGSMLELGMRLGGALDNEKFRSPQSTGAIVRDVLAFQRWVAHILVFEKGVCTSSCIRSYSVAEWTWSETSDDRKFGIDPSYGPNASWIIALRYEESLGP